MAANNYNVTRQFRDQVWVEDDVYHCEVIYTLFVFTAITWKWEMVHLNLDQNYYRQSKFSQNVPNCAENYLGTSYQIYFRY